METPTDIAVDATRGKIYWADDSTRKIQRANLDGTNVKDIIDDISAVTGLDVSDVNLNGVVVDGVRGKIYWLESLTGRIRCANLDGTDIEDIVTGLRFPEDIAVDADGGKIYWADSAPSKIRRANLDGTNIENIVEGISPQGIAVDGLRGKIYWTDPYDACASVIQRANLDGTNIENIVTGLCFPEGIAVDATRGKIYWADWGLRKIQRANLDGSNAEDIVTLEAPQYAEGVAVDVIGGNIYWTSNDGETGKIQRANLDGSNVEDIVTGLNSPEGIAVDALRGKIYWTDSGTDKIQRANLDGSNVEDIVTGLNNPEGIAVDALRGKIYWVDTGTDKIQRAKLDGTNIEDIVTQSSPWGITVDAGGEKIYWTSSTFVGDGKVQRANLDGTNIEDIVTSLGSPGFIALDFSTTAGTVTLVDENPLLRWNYHLTHNSGAIEQWTYTGATITEASVDGEAATAGWSVQSRTDTQVVFATTTALTSGELTGFHITGTTSGTGTWTAGSNSESIDGPLPVELATFTGTITDDGILLRWHSISEINNLGFHLYRSETKDGGYVRVTPTLIKGHGTDATQHEYSFLDETAEVGKSYWYVIEDVDFSGNTELCDPIQVLFLPQNQVRSLMPVETRLLQNYPNPFNPETWIPFQLAKDADVTIYIYDIHGQIILTLKLGRLKAGYYDNRHKAAYWNGRGDTGEPVSSGLYFYLLTAENFAAIRKMVIVK